MDTCSILFPYPRSLSQYTCTTQPPAQWSVVLQFQGPSLTHTATSLDVWTGQSFIIGLTQGGIKLRQHKEYKSEIFFLSIQYEDIFISDGVVQEKEMSSLYSGEFTVFLSTIQLKLFCSVSSTDGQ